MIHIFLVIVVLAALWPLIGALLAAMAQIALAAPLLVLGAAGKACESLTPKPLTKPRTAKDTFDDWKCILGIFGVVVTILFVLYGFLWMLS